MIIIKQFVCPVCKNKDYESDMVIDYIGKQKKRFHKDCHKQYIEDQEFKKKEREELDSLVEYIKYVHDVEVIPKQFFSYLQDVRNGNELFGNIGKKKTKQGYSYYVIEQTYRECENNILWARQNKNFKSTFPMLKYSLAIIKDNIGRVNYKIEQTNKQLQEQKRQEDLVEDFYEDEWSFTDEENKNDISDLLD